MTVATHRRLCLGEYEGLAVMLSLSGRGAVPKLCGQQIPPVDQRVNGYSSDHANVLREGAVCQVGPEEVTIVGKPL